MMFIRRFRFRIIPDLKYESNSKYAIGLGSALAYDYHLIFFTFSNVKTLFN